MPATAAITEPFAFVFKSELVTPDIAKEVVVAEVVVARVVIVSVRPLRVVRLLRVVVPARFVSKRAAKVVVYTPFVTVPAFPVIEPVMVLEKVLLPEKVLLLARSVEEAAVIVMSADPLKEVPLMFLAV